MHISDISLYISVYSIGLINERYYFLFDLFSTSGSHFLHAILEKKSENPFNMTSLCLFIFIYMDLEMKAQCDEYKVSYAILSHCDFSY